MLIDACFPDWKNSWPYQNFVDGIENVDAVCPEPESEQKWDDIVAAAQQMKRNLFVLNKHVSQNGELFL